MSAPILKFVGVSRVYHSGDEDVRALDEVSFHVDAGELVAVMGPSGSGKSTLLALAGGLDVPTSGSITVGGTEVTTLAPTSLAQLRRDRIGYVFQDFNLISELTAAENVALPRELAGVRPRAARREAIAALAEVGVDHLAHRFPEQMSGGQQQRIAIARALVGERHLVLADEPTGALDSQTGEAVMEVLRARVDAGAAGVLVTHEPRYAGWADRTIFLRDGRVVEGTTSPVPLEQLLRGHS
ncbi:ABC transporter ATP-binding protein [Actinoplanes sp. NPDC051859]|uniref:ABC transporter ATP-binding protein n=1 Tax=Actinoplanes sp. NPDC051859 TaxID=3363909 RepID=UPI00379AB8B8